MTEKERIRNVLRDAVLDIGKTQKATAELAGIDRRTLNGWLNGRSVPSVGFLVKLISATSDPEEYMARLVRR